MTAVPSKSGSYDTSAPESIGANASRLSDSKGSGAAYVGDNEARLRTDFLSSNRCRFRNHPSVELLLCAYTRPILASNGDTDDNPAATSEAMADRWSPGMKNAVNVGRRGTSERNQEWSQPVDTPTFLPWPWPATDLETDTHYEK